ncbi:response regulator, partial [Oharaeibacter diazotrophicus]
MSAIARPPTTAGAVTNPIRVMVVDDSVVIRGLVGRWVDEDPQLAVVASHRNGRLAVEDVQRSNPDVVILDIEMPDMDGLTALPLLLERKKDLVVVVASTLTRRNAEISLKALSLGAADYVPKPESNSGVTTSPEFRRELVEKVLNLGLRARARSQGRSGVVAPAHHPTPPGAIAPRAAPAGAVMPR